MRNTWAVITAVLAVVGFAFPVLWLPAIATAILAICSSPGGNRPDGEKRSGGLLGWLVDDIQIARTMEDCPDCRMKMFKTAKVCPHCGYRRPQIDFDSDAAREIEKNNLKV